MAQHNGQIELVGGSLAQLFKINQGIQQCLTPQQQKWYPSKQVKGPSSATGGNAGSERPDANTFCLIWSTE